MVGWCCLPTMEQGSRNLRLATDLWPVASSPPFRYPAAGISASRTEPWKIVGSHRVPSLPAPQKKSIKMRNAYARPAAMSKISCAKYVK